MAIVNGFDLDNSSPGFNATGSYTEGSSAILLAPKATVTASGNFSGQTLTISGLLAEDNIGFGNGVTIVGNSIRIGNSVIGTFAGGSGGVDFVVTFSNNATDNRVQTLLRNLTFLDTSETPITSQTLTFNLAGTSRTDTLTVTPVNDLPLVDLNGPGTGNNATGSFIEQTPSVIAPAATISDPDSSNIASLTARLTMRPDGNAVESLSLNASAIAAAAGLTVTYNQSSGTLSITGSASQATYQAILQGIQYNNSSNQPTSSNRTVEVVVGDGTDTSVTRSVTIGVAAANDAPVVDLNGGTAGSSVSLAYTIGSPLTKIAPAGTVIDVDSANFNGGSLSVKFTQNGVTTDRLGIIVDSVVTLTGNGAVRVNGTTLGSVSGGTNGTDLVITFSNNNSTPAAVQILLEHIGYANTSGSPSTLTRELTFTLNDGDGTANSGQNIGSATATITFPTTNAPPVLTGDLAATVSEGGSYVITTTDLNFTDPDDSASGVTFTVTNPVNGTVLVNGSSATSFTGQQLAAGQVSFQHNGSETSSASFAVSVEDGNEDGSTPVAQTFNFSVTAQNDAPVLTGDLAATVAEGGSYVITTADLNFTDPDDGAADVTFTVTSPVNGTVLVNGSSATSFTGQQLAAGQVSFQHNGSETSSASFAVSVEDGNEDSSTPVAQTFNFNVTAQNDAPVLTGDLTAAVQKGGTYAVTTTDLNFTDPDDAASDVTFTVTSPVNGTVLVNGSSATSFTGQQLAAGQVSFQHNGSQTSSASFAVSVEDGNEDGSTPVAQTFNLAVFNVVGGEEVVLTTGTDVLAPSAVNTRVTADASTLNPTDNLDGGDGIDSLALFGGGTFDLNALAGFANFEKVEVVNISTTPVTLTLRDGTTSDVTIGGAVFTTQLNLSGTASAGTILGGDGADSVSLAGSASATTINLGNGNNQSVTLSDDASAGSILGGTGNDAMTLSGNANVGGFQGGEGTDGVTLSGNASMAIIDLGNGNNQNQFVSLFDASSATTIQGGSGRDSINLSSSGSANVTTISLGGNVDFVTVADASAWNPNVAIDAGSSLDTLSFGGSNQTYDLRPTTLTGIETLSVGDNTALVDGDTLTGITSISGSSTSKLVTGEASLDLTGKTVSGLTIHSSNATGTTFTVDSKATGFQVFGGDGSDTLQTSSFAFTASEREAIFFNSSIETIVDTEGTFHSDSNAVILTEGTDILTLAADDDTVKGTASTLNPTDNLDGGDGIDSLALFGGGTFDLNALAGFANFEKVEVVNNSTTPVTLTLRDGTTSDVTIGGAAFTTQLNLSGTASAGTILGGAGADSVSLAGSASATTINLGNGNNQSVTLSDDANVGSILGGTGNDAMTLSGNANVGSFQGGEGTDGVSLSGNASMAIIDLGNGNNQNQFVSLFDASSATTIQGGSGRDSINLSSSGSANVTTISLGGNVDFVTVADASAWNPNVAIDAGSSLDTLSFGGSNQTYDLRPTTLTGIETLSVGDNTALVDGDTLTGITSISGSSTSKLVTGEASLDLTGKTVSGLTIHSSNATGTTFTVDSKATGFQVFGGDGSDTLQTSSFAFTASEREAIFFNSSIETIVDTEGTFHSDSNAVILTEGTDILTLAADDDTVKGTASTLNPTDNLDGGDGIDSLALFGGGTFDLNALAGFANFEKVEVVNNSTTPVTLTLRDGTTSDVTIGGAAFTTQLNLSGTASAGTILGGAGADSVSLAGSASATTINLGNGNNQSVTLSDDANVGSFQGGEGTDGVTLSGNASLAIIDLGNGNNQFVSLFDASSATTIQGGSGRDSINLSSSGSANVTTISLGGNVDFVTVADASAWNPNVAIDAGSSLDTLSFGGSNQTYDLRPTTLTGIETLSVGDNTALVDGDTLTGITSISGSSTSKLVTGEASLDLTGKTVSGLTIHSSNATGTTFTVDSKATGFQVFGGDGSDTLQTSSFAFTASEREAIFFSLSIETIRDTSGIYGDETANMIVGTAAADNIQGGAGADRLTGAGGPDFLAGGADADTFVFNLPSEGVDTVGDFVSGADVLEVSAAGFGGGLVAGMNVASVYGSSSDATFGSSTERFHYDTSSSTLYFDADGSASGTAAVALAQFANGIVLDPDGLLIV
ncbi:cadherin-like domain-containing protein [Bradyrhizobium sp. CB1717]|uniref:cadherin-like domain-containing protein n=1 Tax=Bradyrhizobium sp. CB1717 TaxID=3039154 RepID=UPI0024B152B0|nr:cadherin-like domain-containing protein [Bradyrhizobium sp. CB1717]WFU25382.1 cadherin-like domain-containing protein [Bradyrhizobium sp. CB1717]